MKAKTRMFGEIDIQEDKIITLESGMIGFPDMQKFTLIFDEEKGSKSHIMWLQSMDDPQTAFPVINPVTIKEDYNPSVSEELLKPLGDMKQEDTFVLTTVRVPKDIQDMSINLKAPIIINMSNNRGGRTANTETQTIPTSPMTTCSSSRNTSATDFRAPIPCLIC